MDGREERRWGNKVAKKDGDEVKERQTVGGLDKRDSVSKW